MAIGLNPLLTNFALCGRDGSARRIPGEESGGTVGSPKITSAHDRKSLIMGEFSPAQVRFAFLSGTRLRVLKRNAGRELDLARGPVGGLERLNTVRRTRIHATLDIECVER